MRLRELNVGCFGGGTGSAEPARRPEDATRGCTLNAVVTMFDSGGSSGQLRDELGVLPPGDILQVRARAGAQRARSAPRAARAAADARARAARRPHRRQPAAVDDAAVQRRLPRRGRRPARAARLPRAACGRSASSRRASAPSTATARVTRGEVEVDAGQTPGTRRAHLARAAGRDPSGGRRRRSSEFDAVDHRPGQLLHQPDADFSRARRRRRRCAGSTGPIMLVANLLTEGRGMGGFTAGRRRRADRARRSAGRWTS